MKPLTLEQAASGQGKGQRSGLITHVTIPAKTLQGKGVYYHLLPRVGWMAISLSPMFWPQAAGCHGATGNVRSRALLKWTIPHWAARP